jgi:hypothetical protein
MDLLTRLGITVYPSEDLKSRRVSCQLSIGKNMGEVEQVGVVKKVIGSAYRIRTGDLLLEREVS